MTMQKTLEMSFATEGNKSHLIRVYDAREDVTGLEVATVMDNIVTSNIFSGTGGEIIGKVSARIVTRETQDLALV